ncbi:MAG: KH domain-containing protein [Firmicutes bacterium]|nr:KH domain-containing protein [Bacillota bacterium]
MRELIELLAKSLVDNSEAVQVNQIEGEKAIIIELKVASEDMGKVIGKQGKIARAIRTLAKATGAKMGRKVFVEITS